MILTMLLAMLAGSPDGNDKIIEQFQNPTRAARPYVWWHWMDGEVSLDGIKKDLEWMDAVGIPLNIEPVQKL